MLFNALARAKDLILRIAGDVVPGKQFACERFARFQTGQAFGRADAGNTQFFQGIDNALRQRFLRPDDHEIGSVRSRRAQDILPGLAAFPFSEPK